MSEEHFIPFVILQTSVVVAPFASEMGRERDIETIIRNIAHQGLEAGHLVNQITDRVGHYPFVYPITGSAMDVRYLESGNSIFRPRNLALGIDPLF